MLPFKLKIDLSQGIPIEESGFENKICDDSGSRLAGQSKFETGTHTFYLAGKCYSMKSEFEIREWMGLFHPKDLGAWAKELDGDFSLVAVDQANKIVYLVSDRNAVERAYYSSQNGCLCISNSLLGMIGLMNSPNISSFAAFQLLTMSVVIDPLTFIENAWATMPGQFITFEEARTTVTDYYSPIQMDVDYFQTEAECVHALDAVYREIFRKRNSKERKMCVSLSGGIDSVAAMKYAGEQASEPIHSLTYSVLDHPMDDVDAARIAAEHFGSIHHEVVVDPSSAARLWMQVLKQGEAPGQGAIFFLAARTYLESLGEKFDLISGDDIGLHTPQFDFPKELGILVNRGNLRRSTLLGAFLLLAWKFQKLWPFVGRNYLRSWLHNLEPAQDLEAYLLDSWMAFRWPEGCGVEKTGLYSLLTKELPEFGGDEGMQEIYKKYVALQHRSWNTDDANCSRVYLSGPSTEVHLPFCDWQSLDVSNRIPYHLGMRPMLTSMSWNGIPLVRKRILRLAIKDSTPRQLLYRAKALCLSLSMIYNSSLRYFDEMIFERWGEYLLESLSSEVGGMIRVCFKSFLSREIFRPADDSLLTSIGVISYLSILNQACRDPSFKLADELEKLCEAAMSKSERAKMSSVLH